MEGNTYSEGQSCFVISHECVVTNSTKMACQYNF